MTQNDIKKVFEGATDEQIKALLDINSADVEKIKKAHGDIDGQLAQTKADLEAAQTTISDLEKNKGDVAALQKTIDDYKAADEQRAADQAAAAVLAEQSGRFDKVLGDRAFAHDYIRDGVFADFQKLLDNPDSKGKSDAELFDALTKDKEGVFQPQSVGINMGVIRNSDGTETPASVVQTSKELNKHRLIK